MVRWPLLNCKILQIWISEKWESNEDGKSSEREHTEGEELELKQDNDHVAVETRKVNPDDEHWCALHEDPPE